MHRVGRDQAWFLRRTERSRGLHSSLFLLFGEIDVRVHLGRIAARDNVPVDMLVDDLVERYLDAIDHARSGRMVTICGIIPVATDEMIARTHWLPASGTSEERVVIARRLNQCLRAGCLARGFTYCEPYGRYADERGFLREELSDGNVHLSINHAGPMKAAVEQVFDQMRRDLRAQSTKGPRSNPCFIAVPGAGISLSTWVSTIR
jgi:hypothetical protein